MITLKNGDKWIIDDSEIEGLDHAEACKGNVPHTEIRDFVERLCKAHEYGSQEDEENEYLYPRKLTDYFKGGYWDANFNAFDEVFGSVAELVKINPWSTIYEMPWNTIIVVFQQADCGGCDVETAVKVYNHYLDYFAAVLFE